MKKDKRSDLAPGAAAADLVKEDAARFHRQLFKGDLASEYDNEIRLWLEELQGPRLIADAPGYNSARTAWMTVGTAAATSSESSSPAWITLG